MHVLIIVQNTSLSMFQNRHCVLFNTPFWKSSKAQLYNKSFETTRTPTFDLEFLLKGIVRESNIYSFYNSKTVE